MELLRDDLIISPAKADSNMFTVRNPSTSEEFEFGEKEIFLMNQMKQPYNEKVLFIKFKAKFQGDETDEFLSDLISILGKRGLLRTRKQSGKSENIEVEHTKLDASSGDNTKQLNHWVIFKPAKVLDIIVRCFGFCRFFNKLILLLFVVALFALFFNLTFFEEDLLRVSSKLPLFQHLLFTLFTINLFSQVAKGATARCYDLDTPSFGWMLAYGILPRFDLQVKIEETTSREAKLWLTASSLLVRIYLFDIGILIWIMMRPTGSSLSVFGAALALFSIFSLFFIANPLLSGDGYRFITLYYDIPNIREKAVRSFRNYLFSTPEVIKRHSDDRLALKIYGALSLLFIATAIAFVTFSVGRILKENYSGFGVVLFFLIIFYLILRYRYLFLEKKKMQAGLSSAEIKSLHHNLSDTSLQGGKLYFLPGVIKVLREIHWLRTCFVACFIFVLFLPYQYEAGGSAVILPVLSQKIYPEKRGIVKIVYFNGGEWLEKGTLIAEMENYRQKKDVELARQSIKKMQQEIDVLLTTPSNEELELARQQLLTAKLKLKHSIDDFLRIEALYKEEIVPLVDYLSIKEDVEQNQQEIKEREANLDAVKNQVNVNKIESYKSELLILERELQFHEEELEHTMLRMPSSGKIITMNLKNLEKKFLDDGMFFAEIEDASQVQVEILIPESEGSQISLGQSMQFKSQLFPNKTFTGTITAIYPVAEATSLGAFVKIVSILPNTDFMLKSGMTGYAKIKGEKTIVIKAFSKALVSFFLIEFWSWLP